MHLYMFHIVSLLLLFLFTFSVFKFMKDRKNIAWIDCSLFKVSTFYIWLDILFNNFKDQRHMLWITKDGSVLLGDFKFPRSKLHNYLSSRLPVFDQVQGYLDQCWSRWPDLEALCLSSHLFGTIVQNCIKKNYQVLCIF